MTAINLNDRSKNSPYVRKELEAWDRANPAEHLEAMQRRGELKHLKPSSYDRAYKPRFEIKDVEVDAQSGCGFSVGDRVVLSPEGLKVAALAGMPQHGTVSGIKGAFIRVGRELYAPRLWSKCR